MQFPLYDQLQRPDADGLPLAWGLWGPSDEIGTLNHLTDEVVRDSAKLVVRGQRFNLNLPLHVPFGVMTCGVHRTRAPFSPTMFRYDDGERIARDDKIDGFFLQGSTQWDGLTHIGDPKYGFYNGVKAEQVTHGEGSRNGIDKVAAKGIVGRGVLCDLVHYFGKIGREWHPTGQDVASADDVAACLADQKVSLKPGDILLVRTGWVREFLSAPDQSARDAMFRPLNYSGLSGEEDMWRFIWDNRLSAVAGDNVALELFPLRKGRPSLHLAIARLGITIGELFDLEALAQDSSETGNYECLFVSSPLNMRGGVGSPGNALAIR
jgi:hypothetical protein